MADALGSLEGLIHGPLPGDTIRVAASARPVLIAAAADPFEDDDDDDEKDDKETASEQDCECAPDAEDCECGEQDDEEGTEPMGSAPEGEGNLIKPTDERQRIAAILTCEEAKGREELARALALETNHTVEAAKKLLAAAPVAAAPAPVVNALEAHMAQIENPKVGVPAEKTEADDSPATEAQRILAFVPKDRKRLQLQ
jgi:hypothetical protein